MTKSNLKARDKTGHHVHTRKLHKLPTFGVSVAQNAYFYRFVAQNTIYWDNSLQLARIHHLGVLT